MSSNDGGTLVRLFDRGLNVIIGFFSSTILSLIIVFPHKAIIGLVILVIFIVWSILYEWLRYILDTHWRKIVNERWLAVLKSAVDFVSLLGVFLIIQFFLRLLEESFTSSDFNLYETFLGLFVIMLSTFSVYHTFKYLHNFR